MIIFEQGVLPCLTNEGKIIMEEKHKVAPPDTLGMTYRSPSHQMEMVDYTSL